MQQILSMIKHAGTPLTYVMEVPMEDGSYYPFTPKGWKADDLLLPLESERTEAGKGLVRALWFDKEVYLWINDTRFTLVPYRCHITGETFAQLYREAKEADPRAEVSAVWEFRMKTSGNTDNKTKAPEPLPLHVAGEPEHHLDHPSYH